MTIWAQRQKQFQSAQNETGQSLVEFMIILPLLLLLLAGVFDVGRSLQAYVVMLNASREAAMMGAAAEVQSNELRTLALEELVRGGLDPGLAEVTIQYQQNGFPPPTM